MRPVLAALGIVMIIMGLVWIGQGTGVFPYPASSFMIDDMNWAYIGAGTALAGLALAFIFRARRG